MDHELFPNATPSRNDTSTTATAMSDGSDDAFNLFGAPPLHTSAVNDPIIRPTHPATTTAASVAPAPQSPSNYELFPMASASRPPPLRSSSSSDMTHDRVEVLPMKVPPTQFARAQAPPPDEPLDNAPSNSDVIESHEFELFPAHEPDATTFSPPVAAAAVAAELSPTVAAAAADPPVTVGDSIAAVATAAMAAAGTPLVGHKMSGNAVDIVAVRNTEDQYFTTPWHVSFGWSRFRSNLTTGVGDMVRVFVNGQELPTKMQLLERGRCVFVTGGLTPPVGDLLFTDLHDDRPNVVRFEHYQKSSDTYRFVDARLYVWGPNESVVVADLDGTLTISDVEGHIRTLRLGQYDFLHKGACDFFMKLHELGLKIVYLTARPIDWATASRTHLENATQHAHSLPPGPLITNSNGLTGALLTEVVNKNPHVFKAQVLNEIQLTLIHAGRVTEHPVFVAGFGNRPTDIVAYEAVGMDPALIFMLDPYSNLRASSDPRIYESYADPNALLWLLPRLKHRVPIEKVARIDDYTVRELVLADDREQLLLAERRARAMQEQEYMYAMNATAQNTRNSSSSTLYGS